MFIHFDDQLPEPFRTSEIVKKAANLKLSFLDFAGPLGLPNPKKLLIIQKQTPESFNGVHTNPYLSDECGHWPVSANYLDWKKLGEKGIQFVNNNDGAKPILPAQEDIINVACNPEITREQKHFMMKALGFEAVGKSSWMYGKNEFQVEYDINDPIDKLMLRIYFIGYSKGKEHLKESFKTLMGI